MGDATDDRFRSLFKSGSFVFVGMIAELAIAFFGKLYIARELGRIDYGAVAIGTTVLATATTFALLGMNHGLGRYLPRYSDDPNRRGIVVSALEISGVISVAVAVLVFVFADGLARELFRDPSTAPVLRIIAPAIPFLVLMKLGLGGLQGDKRTFPKVLVQNLLRPVSRLALFVVVLLSGMGVLGVAWAYTLSNVAAGVMALYFLVKYLPINPREEYVSYRRELVSFSAPLVVTAVMSDVLTNIDTYILGFSTATTTGDIGVYNVVYPIATLGMLFLYSFGYLLLPILSELHGNEELERMHRFYQVATKWMFFATGPIIAGVVLFPEFVIRLTFGGEYASGALALQILILGFGFHVFVGPNSKTLTSLGETRALMYANVATAALNVVLNFALIPLFGIVGAALATALSYVGLNVFESFYLHKLTGVHPLSRALLVPTGAAVALLVLLGASFRAVFDVSVLTVFGFFVLAISLYPAVIVAFGGVESEEVMIVESIEHRFDVDLEFLKRIARRLS